MTDRDSARVGMTVENALTGKPLDMDAEDRLRAALAAEPAAPVAAEKGGEQEAGEAQITDHPFSHDWNPGCGECGEPIRRHTHMEVLPDLNAGPLSLDEVRVIPTPPGAVWLDRRAAAPSGSDDTKGGAK